MIYILRPQMPGLFEVIDAVLDGPPTYATGEDVRRAFGKAALRAAEAEGRALADEDVGTPKFIAWLEANGFKILAFHEVDALLTAEAVKTWNARIVDGPDVQVRNIPPTADSVIPRDAHGNPLVVE